MARQSDIISLASGIIAQHEGFVSKPYLDIANFPTRGYGELLERKAVPKQHRGRRGKYGVQLIKPSYCRQRGWSEVGVEEGLEFLKGHVAQDLAFLAGNIDLAVLSDNKVAAILSLVYNIGRGAWSTSTVRKRIIRNPNDYNGITRGFAMWRRAGGVVSNGLIRRRKEEAVLYCADEVVLEENQKPKRTRKQRGE